MFRNLKHFVKKGFHRDRGLHFLKRIKNAEVKELAKEAGLNKAQTNAFKKDVKDFKIHPVIAEHLSKSYSNNKKKFITGIRKYFSKSKLRHRINLTDNLSGISGGVKEGIGYIYNTPIYNEKTKTLERKLRVGRIAGTLGVGSAAIGTPLYITSKRNKKNKDNKFKINIR